MAFQVDLGPRLVVHIVDVLDQVIHLPALLLMRFDFQCLAPDLNIFDCVY